jgi:hypothetical protein
LELISLLSSEPDWRSFTNDDTIDKFIKALLNIELFVCKSSDDLDLIIELIKN